MSLNRYSLALVLALLTLTIPAISLTAADFELVNPGQVATLLFTGMACLLGFVTMVELRKFTAVPVAKTDFVNPPNVPNTRAK